MACDDEKASLLATIRRQEQEAAALSRRFKLLQQTLKEQQKLLDRYQRALGDAQAAPKPPTPTAPIIDKTSSNVDNNKKKTTEAGKSKEPKAVAAASTWMKKKTSASSDLETIPDAAEHVAVKKEAEKMQKQETKKTEVFKPSDKRRGSSGLAATWAEEKRRMLKKPRWEQNLTTAASTGPNKENVRAEQVKNQKAGFAYVEVVRNREERRALPGHDCVECKKYYDALGGLGAADAAAQKNKCSRHRARFEPYQTPDDFWRLSFPDSEPEPRSPSVI